MSALVAQPASFQSTLLRVSGFQDLEAFQSTLSMRRATRLLLQFPPPFVDISIHALHEESDHGRACRTFAAIFQSTLSMRRATRPRRDALRPAGYFNPRSP